MCVSGVYANLQKNPFMSVIYIKKLNVSYIHQ